MVDKNKKKQQQSNKSNNTMADPKIVKSGERQCTAPSYFLSQMHNAYNERVLYTGGDLLEKNVRPRVAAAPNDLLLKSATACMQSTIQGGPKSKPVAYFFGPLYSLSFTNAGRLAENKSLCTLHT